MLLERCLRAPVPLRSHAPRRGFTLVELLVVLGVIALLVALAAPAFVGVRDHARAARCAVQARSLALATAAWALERGVMPVKLDCGPLECMELAPGAWRCPADVEMLPWQKGSSYLYVGITGGMPGAEWARPEDVRGDVALRRFDADSSLLVYKELASVREHATVVSFAGVVTQARATRRR